MAELTGPIERPIPRVQESAEFRRNHYRVYDEDGYITSFSIQPPVSATLSSVIAFLCANFQGTGGTGFESKDLVVLLGSRIVAVVRKGADGGPQVTEFKD